MTYRVLWLDDKPDPLLIDEASAHGIEITHFKSNEEGFAYLAKHLAEVDAIILDAISFRHQSQEQGTESIKALDEASRKLAELKHQKDLPYFILSGQPNFKNEQESTGRYENFYAKSEDEEQLFADLKAAVDNQPERQLRYRYAPAFAACTDQLLGANASQLLLKVLKEVEKLTVNHNDDSMFNTLRQLVEAFLYAAHRYQLLPDQCLKGSEVNLTASHIFFSGRLMNPPHGGDSVKLHQLTLPKILSDSLRTLVELTSNGSHYQQDQKISQGEREAAKMQLQALRQTVKTPYLLASLTYQLLDLFVWLKEVVGNATLLKSYQNSWEISEYVTGVVTSIQPSGIFKATDTGKEALIHRTTMDRYKLKLHSEIAVQLNPGKPESNYPLVVGDVRVIKI